MKIQPIFRIYSYLAIVALLILSLFEIFDNIKMSYSIGIWVSICYFIYFIVCIVIIKIAPRIYHKNGKYYKIIPDSTLIKQIVKLYKQKDQVNESIKIKNSFLRVILKILMSFLIFFSGLSIFVMFILSIIDKNDPHTIGAMIILIVFVFAFNYLSYLIYIKIKGLQLFSIAYAKFIIINLIILVLTFSISLSLFLFFPTETTNIKDDFTVLMGVLLFLTVVSILGLFKTLKILNNLKNFSIENENNFKDNILESINQIDEFLGDISIFSKYTKLYTQSFRIKKSLLGLNKIVMNRDALKEDEEYFEIIQKRFSQLEEEFYKKNFDLRNVSLYKENVYKDYEKKLI